jgi:hypothetical protein
LATAFRGEADQGDHAEFIALEKKLAGHGCWWTADTRRGRGGAPVLYFRKWNGRS